MHALHELKALGVQVMDNGRKLTHEDINWLEPQKVAEISLNIRQNLGADGVHEVFKEVEEDAER